MSNPLRQRYRALTLPAPQPFVMLSEWIFLNLFNAKRAPRRSQAELNASAEQQRWTWQAIARGEGDPTEFPPKIAEKYAHRDREMAKQREASQRAIAANKAMMEMRKKSGPGSRAIDAENALERLRRQRSESAIRARQALDDLQQRVRTAEPSSTAISTCVKKKRVGSRKHCSALWPTANASVVARLRRRSRMKPYQTKSSAQKTRTRCRALRSSKARDAPESRVVWSARKRWPWPWPNSEKAFFLIGPSDASLIPRRWPAMTSSAMHAAIALSAYQLIACDCVQRPPSRLESCGFRELQQTVGVLPVERRDIGRRRVLVGRVGGTGRVFDEKEEMRRWVRHQLRRRRL